MNTISHTTRHFGGWQPSIGGLGESYTEPAIVVQWSDTGGTTLRINERFAEVTRDGKSYWLQRTGNDAGMKEALAYWLPRIQQRLESSRLTDRVRAGWQSQRPSAA